MLSDRQLDKSIPVPLYYQLKETILDEIKSGKYPKDSMIPTEMELSDLFGISRTTVRQAVAELVNEGWLYRIKSKGTFVSQPKVNQDFIQKLESYNDQIRRTGRTPHSKVLDFKVMKAPKNVADGLDIALNSKVVFLHRIRFADEDPIVIVESYLPYDKCSFVMGHDFATESLYSVLSGKNETKVSCVKRHMETAEAGSPETKLLGISPHKPIFYFTSIGYNIYGNPIEFSLAKYRGDKSSFDITLFTNN